MELNGETNVRPKVKTSQSETAIDPKTITIEEIDKTAGKSKDDRSDMDFDELLPYIGEFGFYQKILFVLMIPFAFFVAWVYFSQIFITLVPPDHWCRVPGLGNLSDEQR